MKRILAAIIMSILFLSCEASGFEEIEKFDSFERDNEAEWIFLWSSKDVEGKRN